MDDNQRRRGGLVDGVNGAINSIRAAKQLISLGRAGGTAASLVAGSGVGLGLVLGIAGLAILGFFLLTSFGIVGDVGLEGAQEKEQVSVPGPPGGEPMCRQPGAPSGSSGSLDYYIPIRDTSVQPDPAAKQAILTTYPKAKIEYWDLIVNESIKNGWNPSFILTLWVEETGASHHTKIENGGGGVQNAAGFLSNVHTGCAPDENQTIQQSLTCIFKNFTSYNSFQDLMCVYGGDGFHKAPCAFQASNPHFPNNIRSWYSRIVPSANLSPESLQVCIAGKPSGWPTTGIITQGTRGLASHDRIYRDANGTAQAIDIANRPGTPIYSTLDGVVKNVNYCVITGTCHLSYGNSIELQDNSGSATIMHGHFMSMNVQQGDIVKKNQQIGLMGNTGYVLPVGSGWHLHWEFRNLQMAPPNVPQAITPENCDPDDGIPCSPTQIAYTPTQATQPEDRNQYWFLLRRHSKKEILYLGFPGDEERSKQVAQYNVNPGIPGERPTPLPQLTGRDYWTITQIRPTTDSERSSLGPYFLTFDVPNSFSPPYGPVPYNECDGQCNWVTPGEFGLHGINGDSSKLTDAGSSGCVRHSDQDITAIYNALNGKQNIRYYIEDI